MSPLEKIKNGIESGDWSLVCDGYNQMTGESVGVKNNTPTSSVVELAASILDILEPYIQEKSKAVPTKKKRGRPKKEEAVEKVATKEAQATPKKKSNVSWANQINHQMFTVEPTEQDIKEAEAVANNKIVSKKRKAYVEPKCFSCGSANAQMAVIEDENVFICNDCMARRKFASKFTEKEDE